MQTIPSRLLLCALLLLCFGAFAHGDEEHEAGNLPPPGPDDALTQAVTPAAAAPAAAAPAAPASPEQEGDALMKTRKLADYEKAIAKFDAALAADPNNAALMTKAAEARVAVMRTKTHGNIVRIGGTGDTASAKAVWKKYGKRAAELAEKGYNAQPKDTQALLTWTEAYMFHSSSFGILKSLFAGAADQYKGNANALIKTAPKADNAVGHIYMGAFYMVAPWPMSDAKKAREQFEKAVKIAPSSLRNRYYLALQDYKDERFDEAKKGWQTVVDGRCKSGSEVDFCGFVKKQAKEGLAAIAAK